MLNDYTGEIGQVRRPFLYPIECDVAVPKPKIRAIAGPLLALVLFGLAIRLLFQEAQKISWTEFVQGITSVPPTNLAIASILVAMNYVLYSCYDILAVRYLKKSLPLRRVILASFIGFSLGNNLGTFMAASPIRFRFYSRWGLSAPQIVLLISVLGLSFWSGAWFLGGLVLTTVAIELPSEVALSLPFGTRTVGVILGSLFIGYAIACCVWKKPWPIGNLHLRLPTPGLMWVQTAVGALDLFISATALYLVLPANAVIPFGEVMAAFLIAFSIALLTQVPGGLGILEAILLKLLADSVGQSTEEISGEAAVLGTVIIFRLLYYWIPGLFGMIALVAHEIYEGVVESKGAKKHAMESHAGERYPEPGKFVESETKPTTEPGIDDDDGKKGLELESG